MTYMESHEVRGDFAPSFWYEVRLHVDDIPWIYDTQTQAYRKARRVSEKSGYPVLVYECSSRDGEKLIAVVD